jgi:hypothetical protein
MMKSKYKKDSLPYFKELAYRMMKNIIQNSPDEERATGSVLFAAGMTDEQFEELKAEVEKL